MNFLFETYSGVAWWQLVLPWVLVWPLISILIFRNPTKTIIETVEVPRELSGRETSDLIRPYALARDYAETALSFEKARHAMDLIELSRANDKVRSLEAQIDRIISRPRGKSGRFERAKK